MPFRGLPRVLSLTRLQDRGGCYSGADHPPRALTLAQAAVRLRAMRGHPRGAWTAALLGMAVTVVGPWPRRMAHAEPCLCRVAVCCKRPVAARCHDGGADRLSPSVQCGHHARDQDAPSRAALLPARASVQATVPSDGEHPLPPFRPSPGFARVESPPPKALSAS